MLLSFYQIFIFLLGHLQFFSHFSFTFMENLFKKHPILISVSIVIYSAQFTVKTAQSIDQKRAYSCNFIERERRIGTKRDEIKFSFKKMFGSYVEAICESGCNEIPPTISPFYPHYPLFTGFFLFFSISFR